MKSLICFFLILSMNSFSQEKTIIGVVNDFENKSVLQFVNIGIANKNVGTVSSNKGKFSLKIDEKLNQKDSVSFSYIGYKTLKIPVEKLNKPNNIVELEREENKLDEVVIKFVKPKHKKIGRSAKGLGLMHMNFYTAYEKEVDDRLSKEIGMKFKLKKDCKIEDLNFNITSNEFNALKFRLNFYKVENGLPTVLIVEKNIIFEIKEKFLGWYKLDLKPYEIYLDQETEDFAVTIQWVESKKANEKSKYFAISTAASVTETAYYREKAMDSWSTSGQGLSFYLNAMCK